MPTGLGNPDRHFFSALLASPFRGLKASEELIDGCQTVPYQPGALIWGGQLSGSVSNQF